MKSEHEKNNRKKIHVFITTCVELPGVRKIISIPG